MKKIFFVLSLVGLFTLSSFRDKPEVKKEAVKLTYWRVTCGGVITGYFVCDCTQGQANAIGAIMCL